MEAKKLLGVLECLLLPLWGDNGETREKEE